MFPSDGSLEMVSDELDGLGVFSSYSTVVFSASTVPGAAISSENSCSLPSFEIDGKIEAGVIAGARASLALLLLAELDGMSRLEPQMLGVSEAMTVSSG